MSVITIEWERVVLNGEPLDLYLARLIEPYPTAAFATLCAQEGEWRLFWYPNATSDRVRNYKVSCREKGVERVEKWAAHHGLTLPEQPHPGYCAVYEYETRQL
jgi:hypothetical protein